MTFKYIGTSKTPKDPRRQIIDKKGYGKNWFKIRKIILDRDNYTCQKCKRKGQKKGRHWDVAVHHIIKIKMFVNTTTKEVDYANANLLSNLITLCNYGCHKHADGHQNKSGFKQIK